MNRFAKQLTNYPPKAFFWLMLAVGIAAYLIPWVINPGISTTLGGWDLAEWASLHPAVRFGDPNLTIPLHLRLVPVGMLLIISLNVARPRFSGIWWLTLGVILVGAIMLAPPPEFLNNTGDVNYRQQFTLAAVALVGGIVALSGMLSVLRLPLTVLLSIVGIMATLNGLQGAYNLMQGLNMPVAVGFGGILSTVIFVMFIVAEVYIVWQKQRGNS